MRPHEPPPPPSIVIPQDGRRLGPAPRHGTKCCYDQRSLRAARVLKSLSNTAHCRGGESRLLGRNPVLVRLE
ncbi:hypothetical protein F8B43_3344 [Methylorubrum populi]|uniref:Uncharacterized protein n=1 Tax=Methylorubrum populi TaxID=223967 RepID=A0A833J8L2_9HYPH|nr:hypothetical protein F8B43_3344 [Methylorubrum populi]